MLTFCTDLGREPGGYCHLKVRNEGCIGHIQATLALSGWEGGHLEGLGYIIRFSKRASLLQAQ